MRNAKGIGRPLWWLAGILIVFLSLSLQAANKDAVDGPFIRSAQAPIDEAFESVTSGNNIQDARVDWENDLPEGFLPKRNSSYPWGTTTYDNSELWVGTIAQGWCVWPVQNLNLPMYLSTAPKLVGVDLAARPAHIAYCIPGLSGTSNIDGFLSNLSRSGKSL